MESQGNGRQAVVGEGSIKGLDQWRRSKRQPEKTPRAWVIWLLCCALLWISAAQAQSSNYVYDANGRVVAVTANNGTSAQYTYNALGNLAQVSSVPAGQLAIFAFMPTHGEAGTQVTLQGQGFDSNVANDTVSFNGTIATVLSASATQLVTTVPSGATTGPISVTVGSQTATSASPFVIDDTGLPPTITQVSPLIVSVGSTVTVAGTHLDPVAGDTTVQMGGRDIPALAALSDTQLQYVVPSNGTSGYVTVATPYGLATSAVPLAALPSTISASSVVSSGNATVNGSGVNLNIGVSGQFGAVTFAAPQSGWVSLQASGITTTASSINYTVYAPGNSIVQQGTISTASPSIHLPHLLGGATYLVLVQPSGAGAQMTLGVESNALLSTNNAATVVTTVAGASKRVLFQTTAVGQNLAFQINSTSTNPAGHTVTYTIYLPNGTSYTSATTASTGVINLGNLPVAGTYQAIIAPGSGVTGAMQVEITAGVTGVLNGTAHSYTANVPGQNIYLSFTATQGENLELALNNVSVPGATYNQFLVSVYNAAGAQISSFWCYPSNPGASCNAHLWYLPAGTYSVVVVPSYGGTIHFNALLQDDIVGPMVATNGTASIALAAGQVERLTFNANVGDTVALNVSGVTTTPAGQPVTFQVYRPDAGAITTGTPAYSTFSPTGAQTVNLPNLPVSGTYTVIVTPNYGLPASAQLSVVAGATGSVAVNGSSQGYGANVTGQNIYLSFTATQGENLELVLNNVSESGVAYNGFQVYVYNAVGAQVTSLWCDPTYPGSSCNAHLWYLPAGTYSVVAVPIYGGTLHFNALLQDDIIGPSITTNGTASIALAAGQVERLTFNANMGDTVALNVSGVTTTPAGQPVTFQVYRPDAGAITTGTPAYSTFSPTGAQTVNLPNLPVSGTYTVIVTPNYGLPASAQLSVVAGATGSVAVNGSSQGYGANVTGQNIYLSFTATQGENLELVLNNVSESGVAYNGFQVYVYNAVGAQVTSLWCDPTYPGSSCNAHLWYLPAGTYSVVAVPIYGGTLHFNALLQDDIIGPSITTNGTASIALAAGQVERLTFNANMGDTVALNVSGVTTTPAGQPVTFQVYRPDAGAITTGTPAYSTFSPTGAQTVNLPNLPVSGTYTVIVTPNYGLPASAQLSVVAGATGSVAVNGSSQSYGANVTSQNIYLSFTATQGENLELALNNVSVPGATYSAFQVNVYNAVGAQITSFWCYPSNPGASCNAHLWYLPAGTYSVVAVPIYGGTLHFNALLQDDIIGPSVATNGTESIALAAGQVERLTFNANVGDTVVLNASNVTTTPTGNGVTFLIYRPDAGTIMGSTPTYTTFDTGGSQTVNLSNLPVGGTYTVIAVPDYGLQANAQLGLVSDTAGTPPTYGTATLQSNDVSQSESALQGGKSVTMTFNANLGDNLELTLSGFTVSGGWWSAAYVNVYNASGTNVSSNNCYQGSTCRYALWNLAAGTYTVVVSPGDGISTVSFNAQLQPDTQGSALSANTPATVSLGQGQVQRLTFNANLGDSVALNLSTSSGQTVYVNVYRPDTGTITTGNYYTTLGTSSSSTVNLTNLPATGTYTMVVYTVGAPATAQLTVSPMSAGSLTEGGAGQPYAARIAGQNIYTSFTANQGDNLELTLSGFTVSGGWWSAAYVNVYNASGTNVSSNYCYQGSTCRYALWNLAAGTYTVVVSPGDGISTVSFNAQLQRDTQGPVLSANVPVTVNLGQGQVQRLTFNANLGDSVALNLTTSSGQTVYVNVYRPDTGAITTGNYYTTLGTSSSSTVNLTNLPAAGTYTVVVYTVGVPATAQLTVSPMSTGSLTEGGASQPYAARIAGQNIYTNFNANQGDNLELTLNNLTNTGSSSSWVIVNVYNATGGNVSSTYCYTTNPGGSCRLALWNLRAGAYSVVVSPPDANSVLSFNTLLEPDVVGAAVMDNTPTTFNLAAGEVERLTFNANLGDTISLGLSNVVTTNPTGQNVCVNVYRPDSGAIGGNPFTSFCASGSNMINLQNLPVGGTYTVVAYTPYGTAGSAQITVAQGTTGTLTENGSLQVYSVGAPGQNVYLNFTANQGDNLELTLNNITNTGSGSSWLTVNVYNATGSNVGWTYCYITNPGGSCRLALWNLRAGTYSVVVTPPDTSSALSFNTILTSDANGPALAANSATTVTLSVGQVARYTFNANLGRTVILNLSGVSTTTPPGQSVYVNVYRPDTGAIATNNYYTYLGASTSNSITLSNLPASGVYTVVVYTSYGTPATAQLSFSPQ